jgi:hypothetical protein
MKRYLIFALLGPLLGGFLLLLATAQMSGYWGRSPDFAEIGKLLLVFSKTLQYTYLFHIVPALMMAAVDDIFVHFKGMGWVVRMLVVGAIGFVAAVLLYGSRGSDSGVGQLVLYGLVGFVPTTVCSWLAHKTVENKVPTKIAA